QHPLHQEVLETIAAQADGALYLTMRMAQLLGRIETKEATSGEAALFRLGIALTKLYTAKQAVAVVSEALECFGGQGYMEVTGLPRLFRDAKSSPSGKGPPACWRSTACVSCEGPRRWTASAQSWSGWTRPTG